MTERLKGKKALVTAAGAGMGRAAVLAFAREGASVVATDINADSLEALSAQPSVKTATLDVTNESAVKAFVESTGAVDILFNCAGWVHQGNILDCRVEDWDKSFNVNVRGHVPAHQGDAAEDDRRGWRGDPQHGLGAWRREGRAQPPRLRREQGRRGRLHARARRRPREAGDPRELRVPRHGRHASLGDRINAFADPVQARKDFIARQPMGRLATAEEIAETFVYLVSDESSFMTGQSVFVDGGMSL
jgi:NAD(P)-dependent dehydrogenase (short-subunit alcohol dehydrogenase family)